MAIQPPTENPEPAGAASRGAHIEAHALGRRFGPHVALENVSLEVQPGECFGLLGANGAGKTTFIRLLTGFLVPSSGSLTVDGISPASEPRRVQARLGYVPETPRLYPELRVRDFLGFAARQAFLHSPSLLIVDEPTIGLDPLQCEEIREALAALAGRCTLLLCTHDLAEARALTQRCAVLRRGALVALAESEALLGGGHPLALFGDDRPAEDGGEAAGR
jgi:ABC-2 type transport system ATP-binding protein